jgi:hypothetical protein
MEDWTSASFPSNVSDIGEGIAEIDGLLPSREDLTATADGIKTRLRECERALRGQRRNLNRDVAVKLLSTLVACLNSVSAPWRIPVGIYHSPISFPPGTG